MAGQKEMIKTGREKKKEIKIKPEKNTSPLKKINKKPPNCTPGWHGGLFSQEKGGEKRVFWHATLPGRRRDRFGRLILGGKASKRRWDGRPCPVRGPSVGTGSRGTLRCHPKSHSAGWGHGSLSPPSQDVTPPSGRGEVRNKPSRSNNNKKMTNKINPDTPLPKP